MEMELLGGYLCDFCHDRVIFHTKGDVLAHHLSVHKSMAYKGYKCSICFEFYTNVDVLEKHLCVHLNGKWYKCTKCNVAFSRSVRVREHLEIHHGVKSSFPCRYCIQKFPCQSSVESHIQSTHNDVWRATKAQSSQASGSKSTNSTLDTGQEQRAQDSPPPQCVTYAQSGQSMGQAMHNFDAATHNPGETMVTYRTIRNDYGSLSGLMYTRPVRNPGATTSSFGGLVSSFGAIMPTVESTVDYDREMGHDHINSERVDDGTSEMEQDSANSYRLSQ